MFTLDSIKTAHARVKSGADFPAYIQELKNMGVTSYDTYVADGHTDFIGENDFRDSTGAKYGALTIADTRNDNDFLQHLRAHQQGGSDYLTFCRQAADAGVYKWVSDLGKMTCTYYDMQGNTMLVEDIPQVSAAAKS